MPADIADLTLERAIRFLTRRHCGEVWTGADEAGLQAWLAAAPEHRAAYERVERTWALAGELRGRIARVPVPRRAPLWRPLVGASAVLLLAVIALPLGPDAGPLGSARPPVQWTTDLGETRSLVLADGTRVMLDAGSELVAQMGPGSRRVTLARGEALFTVRHDAARPFAVQIGSGQVRDLGTRFDVELLRGTTHVAVLEGQVEVATAQGQVALHAGQRGGYGRSAVLLPVSTFDVATGPAPGPWRRFDAEPLADVLERLRRYHAVTFVYTEASLQQLRVSGAFRMDDLPAFLHTLSVALPIQLRFLDPHRIEVSPRPAQAP